MIVIVFAWIILILIGIKPAEECFNVGFGRTNSMALRGICSIEIMLGHIGLATGSVILYPNRKAGVLVVGIFFALSGYGLMYSVSNKPHYLSNFFRKRILINLLLPAYIVFIAGEITRSILGEEGTELSNVAEIIPFFRETNWYVWEIVGLYICFFICAMIDKSLIKSHYYLGIGTLIFVCIAFGMGIDNPWYGSTFCFWVGILYYIKKEVFIKWFVSNHFLLKMFACGALLLMAIVCFFLYGGIVGNLIARNVASVVFVILVLMCLHRYSIGNAVSGWLGKYSYEIYLIHPLLIKIMRPWIRNDVIYAWAVIASTVLISFVYGEVLRKIMKYGDRLWICKTN